MYAAGRRRRRTRRATVWNTQNSRQRQQSRQRYAAGGFAFVPHSCRFLGRQSLGVEPAVKGSSLHLVPILPFRERGTHGPTAKIAGRTTAFLRFRHQPLLLWKKEGPDGSGCRGRVSPNEPFWGRAAITLRDAGGSEAAVRRCLTKPLDRCSGYPQNSLRQSCLDANCSLVPLAFARIAAISRYTADTQELLLERCVVSPRNRTSRNVLRFSTAPPVAMSRQLRQQSR
jgi:hypothetical protein